MAESPLLEVRGLVTTFETEAGVVRAVDGIDLTVQRHTGPVNPAAAKA